jgi:hypothetical protein
VATGVSERVLGARAAEVRRLAASGRAIDPTAPGARGLYSDVASAASKSGVTNPRVVPYGTGMIGAGLVGAGLYSTLDRAPQSKGDAERALWTGAGYGEMGAGVKMLADSTRRYRNPAVALPADDLAAIEGARRMGEGGKLGPLTPASSADPYTVSSKSAAAAAADADIAIEARLAGLRARTVTDLKKEARGAGPACHRHQGGLGAAHRRRRDAHRHRCSLGFG